jgi:polysaccharide export outer membrane protein
MIVEGMRAAHKYTKKTEEVFMIKLWTRNHRVRYIISIRVLLIALIYLSHGILSARTFRFQEGKPLSISEYRIGTKDLLEITVFELPELNQTVRVSEDGSISHSLLGKVEVMGLTAQELEKKLSVMLDQKYTKTAHVTVFIREYQKVAVLGAVGRPGMYELVGPTTLLQIISQAGGLAGLLTNEIFIYRRGKDGTQSTITIPLEELISRGNQSFNIELQPKDVINIPIDQMLNVFVYGEVRIPGAIQFRQSKKITLLQAIAQAGGTTEWASKSSVLIKRKDKKTAKEIKIPVNLKSIISGKNSDILLEEGDVVIVP